MSAIIESLQDTPISEPERSSAMLDELLSGKADIRFNGPVTLSDSEPEPDIAIVRLPESCYNGRYPAPQDIFWIVEFANTSLNKDWVAPPCIKA
ncbi:MAG TPA: hypothetical protein VE944_19690 [Nostoc sp.]|uniref:hypothetical protein n=1 Tax=Nostoc sp. TaxID=1180 RepID=UPI002D383C88|nr:hypothetical protein [Nostoc sp.]HYX16544.1 hypothetical protein [Nostoc sp.]